MFDFLSEMEFHDYVTLFGVVYFILFVKIFPRARFDQLTVPHTKKETFSGKIYLIYLQEAVDHFDV